MPPDDIRVAHAEGQLDFGENYAQELRDKRVTLRADGPAGEVSRAGAELRWHYIGPLQSNKVKYLAGQVHLIHSVDSTDIVLEINRRAAAAIPAPASIQLVDGAAPGTRGAVQSCLVQVNVAGEARKGGVAPERLPALLDQFAAGTHALCIGVMVIPPFTDRPDEARRHFAALYTLVERERRIARPNVELRELSMGMSHDFAEAIAEGATMVRVGTAIFGARTP
jgi:PLP dependent protein